MTAPYKIFHIITTLSSGGAEAMLYKFLKHRSETKIHHSIISLTDEGIYGPLLREMGVPVYCLEMELGKIRLQNIVNLYRLLKSTRPHLLQSWLYHADFLSLILGKLSGKPKIVWNIRCSNVDFTQYNRSTRWIFKLLSKLSGLPDAVVVNSEAGKKFHAQSGYSPSRWKVIPNGFDINLFKPDAKAGRKLRESLGIDPSVSIIGMVARYDPIKDHANFFSAAKKLNNIFHDVCFVLVGRGVDQQNNTLREMVNKTGLENKIFLLGERTDIQDIVSAFDIATLTSTSEGFPNVIAEAMACAVPCVATDVGDSAYIIGDTGKLVPAGNDEALSQAWLELLSLSSEERAKLGMSARKRIETKYDIAQIIPQYEELYLELLH